jgi:hypothetical protein
MPKLQASSLVGRIVTQAIAFVGFLLVPTVITLMAPFTDLTFQHGEGGANVTVKRYVLMFIPWQSTKVENVTVIRADINRAFRYRNTAENRRKGRVGTVSHATGQLVVIGDDHDVIVQAAPEIAGQIAAQFSQFLENNAAEDAKVSVYASWRLSYLLGGVMTGLAIFYVMGVILAILSVPYNWWRRGT